jgi:hypothetical protein
MLDQSLIKSNFIGRDGFIWWIGQIQPEDSLGAQINGGGWGNRFKVRILGYDAKEASKLSEDNVRWAQVMLSPTDGSGAANQFTSVSISPCDMVFGFFLDGAPDFNLPMILGVFGRTSEVSTSEYSRPFQPCTGYTSKIDNDGANIVKNESNENNANSQKSPRHVSLQQAKQIGPEERSAYTAIGDVVKAASGSTSSTLDKMSTEINNFVNKVQSITDNVSGAIGNARAFIDEEIGKITAKIQKISSGLIGGMINNLYNNLAPILNGGLKLLYRTTYAIVFAATQNSFIAHKAGVAAQAAMVAPVKAVQDALPCVANLVLNSIGNVIRGLLSSVADNVTNFVSCIADQFIGGLVNHIIGGIESILSPVLGGVDKILMGFNLVSFLRGAAEGLLSGNFKLSCNEIAPNYNAQTEQWVIGKGAKEQPGISVSDIMESANLAASIATSFIETGEAVTDLVESVGSLDFLNDGFSNPGFEGLVSDCFGGKPANCGGVKVKIFGSTGTGAIGKAILGSIVSDAAVATGSIIGIDLLDGGLGYDYPPFVEITDDCNQGYGAIARAVVDYDEDSPTYGQVIDIYIVSEGENYPLSDSGEVPESKPPYVINGIRIINPGTDYTNNDTVVDLNNPTVEYKIEVDTTNKTGQILRVFPINSENNNVTEVKDLPALKVKSLTGYGATLKATLKPRKQYQGEVKQQIDCISK